jgi:DNA-binding GntR family transcriptional regulator
MPESAITELVIDRPISIRTRVYEHLRSEILNGRMGASSRLVEARLAEQIGASRTPIREALHLLEMEGLVESFPRGGYRVKSISLEEMEELCEIRKANEMVAARWAMERITPEQLTQLEANVARAEAEVKAGWAGNFSDQDAEFHELLARASGSRRLVELCQMLRGHMVLYRLESLGVLENALKAVAGHRLIVDKLRERDLVGLQNAVAGHIETAKEGIRRHGFRKEGVARRTRGEEGMGR